MSSDIQTPTINVTTSTASKKKKRKKKRKTNERSGAEMHRSPFEKKFNLISTPDEKQFLKPLKLLTDSSKCDSDISHLSKSDDANIDHQLIDEVSGNSSYADVKCQTNSSNMDRKSENSCSNNSEQRNHVIQSNDNPDQSFASIHQIKLLIDELKHELKHEFNQRFDRLDKKIDQVDRKMKKRIDQVCQKVDNIYETNATQIILNRIRADHNLDVPYTPTNRTFNGNHSTHMKNLFHRFQNYLKENYEQTWAKNHHDIRISTKPQQIEFDVLGFSFEHSSKKRELIASPNFEAIMTTSSHSYLKPFNANTIIFAEVTTSFLTFHNDDLLIFEKKNICSNLLNSERKTFSFRLFEKLLQLERGLSFILLYYEIQLDHVLVALFGRFIDSKNHRSPEQIYRMLFESSFSKNIPLLHKLYTRDRDENHKQIYFIC